ncbi:MAG TPA: flagellar basal body-associated FliL family protein [Polyangiaceae bacterium]|nr:flagellar basal body-associated FliL family protein [Polyangiaceae bacterium]
MEQAAVESPRVEKKGKGRMVGILVALVLVLSAGAAGAVFAPRLLSKGQPQDKAHAAEGEHEDAAEAPAEEEKKAEEAEEEEEEAPKKKRTVPAGEIAELTPVISDIRAQDGTLRHIKVQIAVELPKAEKAEEFKHFIPYAREATIAYLRAQEFDRLSDPKSFDAVRKEIEKEVIGAVGKSHARRVLITDFVVQ